MFFWTLKSEECEAPRTVTTLSPMYKQKGQRRMRLCDRLLLLWGLLKGLQSWGVILSPSSTPRPIWVKALGLEESDGTYLVCFSVTYASTLSRKSRNIFLFFYFLFFCKRCQGRPVRSVWEICSRTLFHNAWTLRNVTIRVKTRPTLHEIQDKMLYGSKNTANLGSSRENKWTLSF